MPDAPLDVHLQEITASTVRSITDLRVTPEQEDYVASNAVSIAQAYFHPEALFRAVYSADTPVGFVMLRDLTVIEPAASSPFSLWRLMIDRDHQGQGIGRRVLELVAAYARTRPGVDVLYTSYVAGPHEPSAFYLSFGFQPTGRHKDNGEIDLALRLRH